MNNVIDVLKNREMLSRTARLDVYKAVRTLLEDAGYNFFEINEEKPWGAYYRIIDEQAERFVKEFFPELSLKEATLGRPDVCLSPKILVVAPAMRLSWQYHNRRAERWNFISKGGYHRSVDDDMGSVIWVGAGESVQFFTGERHRLCAPHDSYSIVAEIWQHTDPSSLSDESDIIRVADDFNR